MPRIVFAFSAIVLATGCIFQPEPKPECSARSDAQGDAGHESVDVISVITDQVSTGLPNGPSVVVELFMAGPWRPPQTAYSWFVEVVLTSTDTNGVTSTVTITTQRHNGVDETFVTGDAGIGDVTITEPVEGPLIELIVPQTTAWDPHNAFGRVRTGYMETTTSTIAFDTVATAAAPFYLCVEGRRP